MKSFESKNNQLRFSDKESNQPKKFLASKSHKIIKDCHCREKEPIMYVQAGTSTSMGTRRSPFSSLAQAQNYGKWRTLIVLYSPIPLDGGITLRDGQRLIGDKSGLMPIISNTGSDNGGNAVITNGNNCIKNLHFQNIVASAINYSSSQDLCVKNCVIEQYNTSLITTSYVIPDYNQYTQVAALEGYCPSSGRTLFKNIVIRNNITGDAIHDFQYNGSHRKLSVIDCEFYQLQSLNSDESLFPRFNGIFSASFDAASSGEAYLNQNFFHDFYLPVYVYAMPTISAIRISAFDGGQTRCLIKHSRFQNLNQDPDSDLGVHLLTIRTEASTNNPNYPSKLIYAVEECEFYETSAYSASQPLTTANEASTIYYAFKQNIIRGNADTISDFILGSGTINSLIEENFSETWSSFYTAITDTYRFASPINPVIQITDIRKNKAMGAENGGFVGVFPGDDGSDTPYNELLINLEKNCFEGVFYGEGGTIAIGVFGNEYPTGNIIIQGQQNNIVGSALQILDYYSTTSFVLQKNYWGPSYTCSTNSDCNVYQICRDGECVGPASIYTTGGSMIDVSLPLENPIKCYELDVDFDIDSAHSTNNYKHLHLQKRSVHGRQTDIQKLTPAEEVLIEKMSKKPKLMD